MGRDVKRPLSELLNKKHAEKSIRKTCFSRHPDRRVRGLHNGNKSDM